MSTVVEFTLPADAFPLGRILERLPETTVELERVVPTGGSFVPYFWIRSGTDEALVEAFDGRPAVEGLTIVDHLRDEALVRIQWDAPAGGILEALSGTDVVLLSATGGADEWTFEIRSDDSDAIAAFQQDCLEEGIPITITRLHSPTYLDRGGDRLTDPQREALVAAHEAGYFDSPRSATLAEIAAGLGVSRQALSDRLRRGLHTLVDELAAAPDAGGPS